MYFKNAKAVTDQVADSIGWQGVMRRSMTVRTKRGDGKYLTRAEFRWNGGLSAFGHAQGLLTKSLARKGFENIQFGEGHGTVVVTAELPWK